MDQKQLVGAQLLVGDQDVASTQQTQEFQQQQYVQVQNAAAMGVGMTGPQATQMQLHAFWNRQLEETTQEIDFKNQILPLARIKKIMKLDEDVKMISAEAPVLFTKALEIFICELGLRAWAHTEENKRRTLQKNDIAMAISRCDTFDFLIDIVPRDEISKIPGGVKTSGMSIYDEETIRQADAMRLGMPSGMDQQALYYYQLAQQGIDPQQQLLYQQQQQQQAWYAQQLQQQQALQTDQFGIQMTPEQIQAMQMQQQYQVQ